MVCGHVADCSAKILVSGIRGDGKDLYFPTRSHFCWVGYSEEMHYFVC